MAPPPPPGAFDFSPAAIAPPQEPLPVPDEAPPGPDPFAFSPADVAGASDPLPVEPAEPAHAAAADVPFPDLALPDPLPTPAEPPGGETLGFGEVDFSSPPPPPANLPPPAAGPRPPTAAGGGAPEELEMLFGAESGGAAPPPKGPRSGTSFKVRRRSGKVFGPFEEAQVVEMLGKGELMGNEDVSSDGGGAWTPIGAVPAFGEALRKVAAEPAAAAAPAPAARAPFGDRMAGAKVVEGNAQSSAVEEDDEGSPPRWKKLLIPAAALVLVLAVGVGAGFTKQGYFFVRAFRRGDSARVAALVAEARTALTRAEFTGDRAALDAAARALAQDPDALDAAAVHAIAAAHLELRHGAPPAALDQARRSADRLEAEEKGTLQALATRLAVAVATEPGPATAPQENALEAAAAKAAPDADVLALLARAALARGDGPRAAALFAKMEALKPGTPRGSYGTGLALVARRDAAGARAAFERVLQATPGHLPSRLELAALADAAGDLAAVEAQLAWLLAEGADQKLAPAERARALALKASLLARVAQKAAEADAVFDQALKADGRLVEARITLAAHRLRRGDPAGAITALEPVAGQAPSNAPLAALRIRSLAAAGRALDASSLADQALARNPGDPALLLAKAAALEASGKGAEAAGLFRDAAARDPAAFEPRLALGRIALAAGDLEKARAELAAAVEKGPREPAVHALLGELAAAEGDTTAAEKAYQATLALDPEYALAEIGLARLALARGDDAAARARLERALAVEPRNVEGQVELGGILWRAKDLPAAEKAFQGAVDQRPTHALALTRLGAVKLERGDADGALPRLTAAVAEDGKLAEARLWLGRALLKKGETPGAIAALQQAVALAPKRPDYHVQLGVALERSGALTEAIDAYRAASSADPKFAEAYERLGTLYFANGRFEDAAAAYEKAAGAAPKVSRYRIALADCRARLGRHEEAIRTYKEVLRTDPAAVQVYYKLARSVHESEGPKAALALYERASKEERDNAMPHYFLGYAYKERGQKARAVAEFKRFLELKPDADEKKDIEGEIEDLGGKR
jgi:tetratricopeptide (TPR) repeat protein